MTYSFNPHKHSKIWLTNNRDVFMNFENQTRIIDMREKNPKDIINLVYDSSLLSEKGFCDLNEFCQENNIIPVDANTFPQQGLTDIELRLYNRYKQEICNLEQGGNLAVASDILRWLSPVYRIGSYSDLDLPINAHLLPELIEVDAPLLLNLGSLKFFGRKEMIFSNNDYIGVVDAEEARYQIEEIQKAILAKLEHYNSDFIQLTTRALREDSYLNSFIIGSMQNRGEYEYILRSTELKPTNGDYSSRSLRAYIHETMTDANKYLDFHRNQSIGESDEAVISRLRKNLSDQLGFVKWLFFKKEYNEIKQILAKDDDAFLKVMMKKERSLYLKSIVIGTTGPLVLTKTLFGDYTLSSDRIDNEARLHAFSHYGLDRAFLAGNGIPLHENLFGMLLFLGADSGELSDSSWLEEGRERIQNRQEKLLDRQYSLKASLPLELAQAKKDIEQHLAKLNRAQNGWFGFLFRSRRTAKINALEKILKCFDDDNKTFNINALKSTMADLQPEIDKIYAGFFTHRTRDLIEGLKHLCHEAVVLRVAKNRIPSYDLSSSTISPQEKVTKKRLADTNSKEVNRPSMDNTTLADKASGNSRHHSCREEARVSEHSFLNRVKEDSDVGLDHGDLDAVPPVSCP
jgi:glucosyltransferase Lgt1/2/3